MYGTLMRCRPLPGKERAFEDYGRRRLEEAQIEGFLGNYVLTPNGSGGEVTVLVLFDSEESYRANAASPAQHQRYLELRALLAADPEWTDGRIEEWRPATIPI
jgi:heme-degrading monooxygenase HmoA